MLWPVFIEFGDKIASRKVFFVFGNDFALSTALSLNLFGFRKNCRNDKKTKNQLFSTHFMLCLVCFTKINTSTILICTRVPQFVFFFFKNIYFYFRNYLIFSLFLKRVLLLIAHSSQVLVLLLVMREGNCKRP